MSQAEPSEKAPKIVFITGPSGAGRSTAINALEDIGFESIDNLPLSLLPQLLSGPPPSRPLALGTDPRNRDFSAQAIIDVVDGLSRDTGYEADLVYIDCTTDVLVRRFSETRRRHPLSPENQPLVGIELERELLAPLRDRAQILIDTSHLTPHDLKAELGRLYASSGEQNLAISVQSFSYKRGLPISADLVLDCRFLRNPHWSDALRPLDGRDSRVQDFIRKDPRYEAFLDRVTGLMETLLPAFREEGRAHVSIAFGCTGGKHRSVALTEEVYTRLAEDGWQVSKRHREVERRSPNMGQ